MYRNQLTDHYDSPSIFINTEENGIKHVYSMREGEKDGIEIKRSKEGVIWKTSWMDGLKHGESFIQTPVGCKVSWKKFQKGKIAPWFQSE